jgi:hypothetical protein
MACPLFIPSTPIGELVSVVTPLGDLYSGNCAADTEAVIGPDTLRRYCNFGYARGYCDRAAQSDADAVRLMVRSERGNIVEVAWAIERNHHPVAVGNMEIEPGLPAGPAGDLLALQAYACVAAYIRQSRVHPSGVGEIAVAAQL